ncbi:MAG TPA: hypothetical protein VNA15_11575 [Candidatus Angelobacter sp.]|nr:hypothetical protein [Candidatus Angelobacter sp.]
MRPIKTVVQAYMPEPRLLDLMEQFRRMVNLSISVGLETGRTSLKMLSLASYHRLRDYGTPSKLSTMCRITGKWYPQELS